MAKAVVIPSPTHMSFMTWANAVIASLQQYPVPSPISEDKWQEWAESLIPIKELGVIPSANHFDTWQEWAYAFIKSVG